MTVGERSPVNGGVARGLPAGHLRDFEDGAPADLSGILPPRVASPAARNRQADQIHVEEGREAGATARSGTGDGAPDPVAAAAPKSRRRRTASTSQPARPQAPPGSKGPEDRIRASNVHIPVALLGLIADKKSAAGLSNGELVIAALEACHDQLGDLVGQRGATGGSLFATRMTRGVRMSDGPLTAFNIRLQLRDYAVIDELVERHGAYSRGHLVTAALTEYLRAG